MGDDQNSNNIHHLVSKFSALTCPSDTRCKKCVGVLTVYDAYHNLGLQMASCDKCEQTLYASDVVLHCPPNHKHHHEGYDLCVNCGNKILKKQQKAQQNILRQVMREKKRKNRENDAITDDPPKKKRKRGRPRKNPIQTAPLQNPLQNNENNLNVNVNTNNINNNMSNVINININNYNNNNNQNPILNTSAPTPLIRCKPPKNINMSTPKQTTTTQPINNTIYQKVKKKIPSAPHYKDWEKQLMQKEFRENYIKYVRSVPNLYENSIKIINRYSSWLDFTRLNEGSEINILNTLLQFEDIISNSNHNNSLNAHATNQLNNLNEYLTTSCIDYKHIWNDAKTNVTQINEHNAIAKYASNYIAHNSIHKRLFGNNNKNKNKNNKNKSIAWKQISEMIEQSHFIRDWKLHNIDGIIQQQIDILQALIAQHATPKNNLASNCTVWTPIDLRINEWKRHILKLRKIRVSANIGLEFPMNVLKYDRTEIDHIAKISAINGIQHLLCENNKNKPLLPASNISPPPLLKLRDLLPPTNKNYNNPNPNAQVPQHAQQIIYHTNHNQSRIQNLISKQPQKQKQSKQIQQQQQTQHSQQHKPVYIHQTNIKRRINTNNNMNNIDVNRLVNVLANAKNNINPVLNHIAVQLLTKRNNIFPIQHVNNNNNNNNNVPQIKINRMQPIYNNNNNNNIARRIMINKPPHSIHSDNDSSDIEILKVNIPSPNINTNNNINNLRNNIPKLKEFPVSIARVENNNNPAIDLTTNSPPPTSHKEASSPIDTHNVRQVYSDKKYWDQFHRQTEEYFEWFCNYDDISHILDQHINNKNAKILEIGCGLSSMASRMVLDHGYKDILCLDWCESAINKIKTILDQQYMDHNEEREIMKKCIHYTVQDIRSMTFQRRTFDVVIDKGTMDAIDCGVSLPSDIQNQSKLCGSGIENLSDNFEEIVAICSRIHEILKPNGLFIIVTSRSIVKRIEFIDELKTSHKRHFKKLYGENVNTQLKDWRDGDSKTPKLIILQADKNSRKHKHKKT